MSRSDAAQPVTLFVPGPFGKPSSVPRGLPKGVSAEWIENDGHFGDAFRFGPASPGELRAIAAAPGALVLELKLELPAEVAVLRALGRVLDDAGALGVRFEQSKAPWPLRAWRELVDAGHLYRCAVVGLSDREEGLLYTCGMHLFGRPDAQVALGDDAERILTSFNGFQLDEDPLLLSGHTFAPDTETPRRTLARWPDHRYPAGHPCHNPFGVWRLEPQGPRREHPELAIVFMPALVTVLLAAERQAGKPLTRKQVEAIVEKGVCMTMTYEDARALERKRGYADLDPELAWEQWQLVRDGLVGDG